MTHPTHEQSTDPVAACTLDAVHRRDHHHVGEDACRPHQVSVVHLGRRAAAVCHDCGRDTGFVEEREADALAAAHRHETAAEGQFTVLARVA